MKHMVEFNSVLNVQQLAISYWYVVFPQWTALKNRHTLDHCCSA